MERLEFSVTESTLLGSISLQRIRGFNETVGQNVKSKSYLFYCDFSRRRKEDSLTISNGNKNAIIYEITLKTYYL